MKLKSIINLIILIMVIISSGLYFVKGGMDNYYNQQKQCEIDYPNKDLFTYDNDWVLYYPENNQCCHYYLTEDAHIGTRCQS